MTADDLARLHAAVSPSPWSARAFADLLAAPGTILATRPGAFALARVAADEAELLMIATHPDFRRRGRARACLAEIIRAASRAGAATLHLEVAADNRSARALYHAEGFARSGLRQGYYQRPDGHRQDALLLVLSLPQRRKNPA